MNDFEKKKGGSYSDCIYKYIKILYHRLEYLGDIFAIFVQTSVPNLGMAGVIRLSTGK